MLIFFSHLYANKAGIFHQWSKIWSWSKTVTLSSLQTKYNPRQKSWNTCVHFPFPNVDLGITVVSVLQNTRTVRTKVWAVNLKNFLENSREAASVSTIFDEDCSWWQSCIRKDGRKHARFDWIYVKEKAKLQNSGAMLGVKKFKSSLLCMQQFHTFFPQTV